jgi:hypothetical protein
MSEEEECLKKRVEDIIISLFLFIYSLFYRLHGSIYEYQDPVSQGPISWELNEDYSILYILHSNV